MHDGSPYVRPLEPGDVARVAALLDASLAHDTVTPAWVRDKTFADPDYDGALALCAFDEGRLVGFAQGIVRPGKSGPVGCVKWFATAEDARGRGIATTLFDQIESAMARQAVVTVNVAGLPPNYTAPGIDPRYTDAYVFLERRGYKRTGQAFNMSCDLRRSDWDTREEEERLRSAGIIVRRAGRDDQEAAFAFLRAHFAGWLREVAACYLREPIGLHIALDATAGEPMPIAGFAAHDGNNPGMAWFGPMGTDPAYRGRGIGRVLLRRCLADQRAEGHTHSIIPWVGPLSFYWQHCGAVVSRIYWQMEKKLG